MCPCPLEPLEPQVRKPRAGSRVLAAVMLVMAMSWAGAPGPAVAAPPGEAASLFMPRITVLSSAPDAVTGGSALVRIAAPPAHACSTTADTTQAPPEAACDLANLTVQLDGSDITDRFTAAAGALFARLTALREGVNALEARWRDGPRATLALVNHPITGPLFSGPHQRPYLCQTEQFRLPDGRTLGPPLDALCSVATRVDYLYRDSRDAAGLRPLPDPRRPPDEVASVTTRAGHTVRHVVRLETGTANRGIYQVAVLHDPSVDPEPDPLVHWPGWNRRLVYVFGGGCNGGWYRQGNSTAGVLQPWLLAQGYAVASSSLNVFGHNCNELLAAETMAIVKELLIKQFGPPLFTIGWGCSGGSYQQFRIADRHPGLLDGIVPGCSFPELTASTLHMLTDAHLLRRHFLRPDAAPFDEAQQRAVAGLVNVRTLDHPAMVDGVLRIQADGVVPPGLPADVVYHQENNPLGVRTDVYTHAAHLYGRHPDTGHALRPLDNAGVPYGLRAWQQGLITPAMFVELNERIGGFDADGHWQPQRSRADPQALEAAQRHSVVTGGGRLDEVAIIDYRAYTDDLPQGDMHLRYHSFALRERLLERNGHANNHVMLTEDARHGLYDLRSPLLRDALDAMDRWLTGVAQDTRPLPLADKLARHRPPDLLDACMSRDASPGRIAEPQRPEEGVCAGLYPAPGGPRHAAGAPRRGDVLKCPLRPLEGVDWPGPLPKELMERLHAAFPDGMCDWAAAPRLTP